MSVQPAVASPADHQPASPSHRSVFAGRRAFIGAFAAAVFAVTASSHAQFAAERRNLANVYVHDNDVIRVFYDRTGPHAVNLTDRNGNNVPDVVEDVARQTWAAYHLFTDTLGFQDPLKSPRYLQARYIDVNLLSQGTLGGSNGLAYDELQTFNRPIDPAGTRVITFDVATSVNPTTNITPTHELFHLIQNGYTYFKTRWYTEGMARWSEHAIDSAGLGAREYFGPWPQAQPVLDDLFSRAYTSETILWNPLAYLDNPIGSIPIDSIDDSIASLRYLGTDALVLEDRLLTGAGLMREILEELARMDDVAFAALGYSSWTEDNQKSPANSPFIYQAVLDVARRRGHDIGPYSAVPEPAGLSFLAVGMTWLGIRPRRRVTPG